MNPLTADYSGFAAKMLKIVKMEFGIPLRWMLDSGWWILDGGGEDLRWPYVCSYLLCESNSFIMENLNYD